MMKQKVCLLLVALSLVLLLPSSVLGDGKSSMVSPLAVTLENQAIRIRVGDLGSPNLETTGGHPGISGDENKPLLYTEAPDPSHTSFSTVRIVQDGVTTDYKLYNEQAVYGPSLDSGSIVTRWNLGGVEVIQSHTIIFNPYTALSDLMQIQYSVVNTTDASVQAGIRCLLDVKVGDNDAAPFFIPGLGRVDREVEFFSSNMPEYYKAFESPVFAENSLRSLGLLKGFTMTKPDRFVIATQRPGFGGEGAGIMVTGWDYAIRPGALLGDSATAAYFGPHNLSPGSSFSIKTGYGLGGVGGGEAWLENPALLECAVPEFNASLFVTNVRTETLFNGRVTLSLPDGLRLVQAQGNDASRSFGDMQPGESRSVVWRVVADMSQATVYRPQARIVFNNLDEPLLVESSVEVPPCVVPPTLTATPGPSPTPTQTPLITVTPGPSPEPTPIPEPASLVLGALGLAGLVAGLRRKSR